MIPLCKFFHLLILASVYKNETSDKDGFSLHKEENFRVDTATKTFSFYRTRIIEPQTARHETVNRRMKRFQTSKQVFRHNIAKHSLVFYAVANLTQLMIENGEQLFSI